MSFQFHPGPRVVAYIVSPGLQASGALADPDVVPQNAVRYPEPFQELDRDSRSAMVEMAQQDAHPWLQVLQPPGGQTKAEFQKLPLAAAQKVAANRTQPLAVPPVMEVESV